jgi:hypothetical protein
MNSGEHTVQLFRLGEQTCGMDEFQCWHAILTTEEQKTGSKTNGIGNRTLNNVMMLARVDVHLFSVVEYSTSFNL